MKKVNKSIRPRYDEITVYMHGISFLLLAFLSVDFRNFMWAFTLGKGEVLLPAYITVGCIYAIVTPLFKKRRPKWEKAAIAIFLVTTNVFIGLYALAISVDPETHMVGLLQVPLVLNVLYSMGFLFDIRFQMDPGRMISDDRPPLYQVIILTFALTIALAILTFVAKTPWPLTYAWCIFVGFVVKHGMDFLVVQLAPKFLSGRPVPNTHNNDAQRNG